MTPSARYRRQVQQIRILFDALAISLAFVALALTEPYPVASAVLWLFTFGCLRIAYDAAHEMERWRKR